MKALHLMMKRYYRGNEGITCTPMTVFKVITQAMKVLHTQQ